MKRHGFRRLIRIGCILQSMQIRQQLWNIIADDAPEHIVINAEIAVNQPIAGCRYLPPLYIRRREPHLLGDMGRGLTDKLDIAQCSIVNKPVCLELRLIKPLDIGEGGPAR